MGNPEDAGRSRDHALLREDDHPRTIGGTRTVTSTGESDRSGATAASPAAPRGNGLDGSVIARANHVWLTGLRDQPHAAVDFADNVALVAPPIPYLIRRERAMLGRMVRYLVGQGVEQFLDLGSGLPTGEHVHEIAQTANPECRV